MPTITISVSPHLADRIERAVDSGAYASSHDVMSDALRLWEQREDMRQAESQRLKAAYTEGMASGAPRDLDARTLLAELKALRG
jgi:antitoxin ParD1/3/4